MTLSRDTGDRTLPAGESPLTVGGLVDGDAGDADEFPALAEQHGHRETLRRRHRRSRAPIGGRTAAALLILVVIVAVVAVVLTPAVRRELRQSFTQMPTRYTELYFTRAPVVEHNVAVVPISLVDHGSGSRTYRIQVWLASFDGRATASTVTKLAPRPGVPTPVVARLPLSSDSAVVHVALLGHHQTLHFRLPARGSPTPGVAP